MSPQAKPAEASLIAASQPIALSLRVSRNGIVQALGMAMVALTGLTFLSWQVVAGWTLFAVAVVTAENHLLRAAAGRTRAEGAPERRLAVLRTLATTVYAAAGFVFIAKGGPGAQVFAFALLSASVVHVMMRYYRSPRILAASLAPWVVILGLVALGLARTALAEGHVLSAITSTFTIGILAVQFWSARAQLSNAWLELMAAREEAETRQHVAEAANRAKSTFLANMSHELRTPLNGVLGMAQALTTDRLTQAQQERVGIIRRSSESLLSVLNDLLDLSRIEASALGLESLEFDLGELVDGVAAAHRTPAAEKGLAFRHDLEDPARGRYLGDPARIRRILCGLADNAVKFTQEGHIALQVDRDADHVIFRVSDTGIGIGRDDLDHLFEGFFQADSGLTRRYGGAGIGLAICHELVGLMGGVISAESTPGVGSTFTVRLPLLAAASAPSPEVAEDLAPEPAAQQATELRVLAAEDNPTNQLVIKTLLAPAGIIPTIVENGREAVAAWGAQTWDIILMDIQMPEMNGIEATLAIRQEERETGRARTPILAVTANAMTHQVVEYHAVGMDGVVPKPVDMAKLYEAMEQALSAAPDAEAGQAQAVAG